jgi:hypothetical protein
MTIAGVSNVADWNEARGVTTPLAAEDATERAHVVENFMAGKPTYDGTSKAVGLDDTAIIAAAATHATLASLQADPVFGDSGTGRPNGGTGDVDPKWGSGRFALLSDGVTKVHWAGFGWMMGEGHTGTRPVATGATAGTPGSWVPADALPGTIGAARTGVTNVGAAWTAGQFVYCENGAEIHWDGDSWEAGKAP